MDRRFAISCWLGLSSQDPENAGANLFSIAKNDFKTYCLSFEKYRKMKNIGDFINFLTFMRHTDRKEINCKVIVNNQLRGDNIIEIKFFNSI